MGTSEKTERWALDGVAQPRNLMHEIALKKQITMYRREEKLLEKELREIIKVKKTLLQIRAPLSRKVRSAQEEEAENAVDREGNERRFRKTSVLARKVGRTGVQNPAINERHMDVALLSGNNNIESHSDFTAARPHRRKTDAVERTPRNALTTGESKLTHQQLSTPVCLLDEKNERNGFLPTIKTLNPPPDCSQAVKIQRSLVDEVDSYYKQSPVTFSPIAMASSTVQSKLLTSHSSRRRSHDKTHELTSSCSLTMEETLRIKGKFRQMGHSVIATALLKGLKQKGQLSSEAIHNMHKPVSLGKGKEKTNHEIDRSDRRSVKESSENKKKYLDFQRIARKAVNVNRMISVGGARSQCQPKHKQTANKRKTSDSTKTNQEKKSDHKDSVREDYAKADNQQISIVTSAGWSLKPKLTDNDQKNDLQDASENHTSPHVYTKQNSNFDALRPLMNPRAAHARRIKNKLSGDPQNDGLRRFQNDFSDVEPTKNVIGDLSSDGNKVLRVAMEAWS